MHNEDQRRSTIFNADQRSPTRPNDFKRTQTLFHAFQHSTTSLNNQTTKVQRAFNDCGLIVFCMTNLSERIRAIAPGNAAHYRLRMQRYDGSTLIYPSDEAAYFDVGEAPSPVPAGTYVITFYDRELRLIAHPHQTFVINPHSEMTRSPQAQLSLNFQTAGGRSAPPPGGIHASPSGTGASSSSAAAAAAPPPKHLESGFEEDLEFRKQLAALDLEERQQEFIKNSTYIKELGEAFVLNRLMRREMIEMQRSVAHQAKQAFLDLGNSKATIQRLLELQDSVLDHVEKHRYVPPAPPPDFVGLGHAAIGMLKDVGVALIQRYGGDRAGLSPAASAQPPQQLPAAGGATNAAPATTSAPAPAEGPRTPDVIDRIGQRLRSLTELDLAKAMSAPESWAGLLQDCLRPESPTEMKAPGHADGNGGDGSDLASGAGPV